MLDRIDAIKKIAKEAGDVILEIYEDKFEIEHKGEDLNDPVTNADLCSEEIIIKGIQENFPQDSILPEETKYIQGTSNRTWLIDPLDGTKDFVYGTGHFSILIGLLEDDKPVFGLVYVPVLDVFYYAQIGRGAFIEDKFGKRKLEVDNTVELEDSILVSRNIITKTLRPLDRVVNELPFKVGIAIGTVGLKAGVIAENKAHLYINTNPSACKWDTCAIEVLIKEANGVLTNLHGERLDYSQKGNKWGEKSYMITTKHLHKRIVEELKQHL